MKNVIAKRKIEDRGSRMQDRNPRSSILDLRSSIPDLRNPKPETRNPIAPAHQFDDLEQQHESDSLGMWAFLATEVMFFGGLFMAYTAYRYSYPEAFAVGSQHLDELLGGINTAVLLTSSLTMALAVHAAQTGRRRAIALFLLATAILGALFLGIKGFEYYGEYQEGLVPALNFSYAEADAPKVQMFFVLYFLMTSLHALHMTIGICAILVQVVMALRGRFPPEHATPVELLGLYWHFVDIVWVFLFPLLYLIA
jgi:cytochrome c oxidase subunit 3